MLGSELLQLVPRTQGPHSSRDQVTPGCKGRPLHWLLEPAGSDPAFPSTGDGAAWFLHSVEAREADEASTSDRAPSAQSICSGSHITTCSQPSQ